MDYYVLLVIVFFVGYLIIELIRRLFFRRKIVVMIKHKDGTNSSFEINAGKDVDVEALLKAAKEKKRSAA